MALDEKISLVSHSWVKQMGFSKGDLMEGHKHTFDHQTILAFGIFEVCVKDEENDEWLCNNYGPEPHILYIPKGKIHKITLIEKCEPSFDGLGFCLHVLRDGERVEDIIDEKDLPPGFDPRETLNGKTPLIED